MEHSTLDCANLFVALSLAFRGYKAGVFHAYWVISFCGLCFFSNKGGRGQRNREEIGAGATASPLSRGPDKTAMLRRLREPAATQVTATQKRNSILMM